MQSGTPDEISRNKSEMEPLSQSTDAPGSSRQSQETSSTQSAVTVKFREACGDDVPRLRTGHSSLVLSVKRNLGIFGRTIEWCCQQNSIKICEFGYLLGLANVGAFGCV